MVSKSDMVKSLTISQHLIERTESSQTNHNSRIDPNVQQTGSLSKRYMLLCMPEQWSDPKYGEHIITIYVSVN